MRVQAVRLLCLTADQQSFCVANQRAGFKLLLKKFFRCSTKFSTSGWKIDFYPKERVLKSYFSFCKTIKKADKAVNCIKVGPCMFTKLMDELKQVILLKNKIYFVLLNV